MDSINTCKSECKQPRQRSLHTTVGAIRTDDAITDMEPPRKRCAPARVAHKARTDEDIDVDEDDDDLDQDYAPANADSTDEEIPKKTKKQKRTR